MWKVEIEGIELPEGWRFMEDLDFLYLVNPEGKIEITWPSSVSKENIKKDISEFFSKRGQP